MSKPSASELRSAAAMNARVYAMSEADREQWYRDHPLSDYEDAAEEPRAAERHVAMMTDTDGMEISFSVQTGVDGVTRMLLRIGGRRGARLDDEEQAEFLRHFRGAQLAASEPPR
jgi:hypothetical protein